MSRDPSLRDLQQHFRIAVTGADDADLATFVRTPRGDVAARIEVYRTTVQESLHEVLAIAFPVTRRVAGVGFFRLLTVTFIARNPPTAPHLATYGAGFADFVGTAPETAALPYLRDVARLEWARGEAYFAADGAALDPLALQAVTAETLQDLRLTLHPATRLIPSAYPILRIWEVNQPEVRDVPEVDMAVAQHAIITRPELTITMREIGVGDATFVAALNAGVGLGDAVGAAMEAQPNFDLQTALQGHLLHGTFAALR